MTKEELDDHVNMLRYFWKEKGDIRRYVSWPEIKAELAEKRPDIIKAWNDYKAAEMILTAVLEREE